MIEGFSFLILLLRKAILLLIILKENLSLKVDDILNNSDKNKIYFQNFIKKYQFIRYL